MEFKMSASTTEDSTRQELSSTRRSVLLAAAALASQSLPFSNALAAADTASPVRNPDPSTTGDRTMGTITTRDGTEIFYKDWGSGRPVVFHHGWPLSSDDWDNQMLYFLTQGYRVIAHDRRGMGARPRRRPATRWTLTPPMSPSPPWRSI